MRNRSFCSFLFLNFLLTGTLTISIASQPPTDEFVKAEMSAQSTKAVPGQTVLISVRLRLTDDAHANSNSPDDPNLIPTVFIPTAVSGGKWGTPKYPVPTTIVASYSPKPLSVFENDATITVPLTLDADISVSEVNVEASVRVQVCDRFQCYPPKKIPLSLRLEITGGSSASASGKEFVKPATPIRPGVSATESSEIDFDFVDFAGKKRSLREFRGKYVLLDFWATWCAPCLADIPKLKKLHEKYAPSGFEILGMDAETIGDEAEDPDLEFAKEADKRARKIVVERGANWPQATWETAVPIALKIFKVKALPTKILLDKKGKVIAIIGEKDDLEGIVEGLLLKTN